MCKPLYWKGYFPIWHLLLPRILLTIDWPIFRSSLWYGVPLLVRNQLCQIFKCHNMYSLQITTRSMLRAIQSSLWAFSEHTHSTTREHSEIPQSTPKVSGREQSLYLRSAPTSLDVLLLFLASQEAQEVMFVSESVSHWVLVSRLDWCDPGEWWYL